MNQFRDSPKQPMASNQRYTFRVRGRLSQESAAWFEDMTLTVDETAFPPQTLIHGLIRDQAALYGLISRIRDLGLLLLSVNLIENGEREDGDINNDCSHGDQCTGSTC